MARQTRTGWYWLIFSAIVTLLVAGILAVLQDARETNVVQAFSSEATGYSGNPATHGGAICTACHSGGVTPTVTLSGPTSVTPGSSNSYSLTISGGQQSGGGLDVAVTGGTLVSGGADTQVIGGELTHSGTKSADGSGNVIFNFNWTAPTNAGTVTIYAAGNSVNKNGGPSGDNADARTLSITVQAATPTPTSTPTSQLNDKTFLPAVTRASTGW